LKLAAIHISITFLLLFPYLLARAELMPLVNCNFHGIIIFQEEGTNKSRLQVRLLEIKHQLGQSTQLSCGTKIGKIYEVNYSGGFSSRKVTHKCGPKVIHLLVNKNDPDGSNCLSNLSLKILF
jgi:hypothetical protein